MERYVDIWVQEKCSKCEREKKCELYSVEMLLCILHHVNNKKEKEGENAKSILQIG